MFSVCVRRDSGMASIRSLDEQIADLERELNNDSDSHSGSEEEKEDLLVETDERGRVVRLVSSIAQLERIAPLPARQLPLPLCTKRKGDGSDGKNKEKPKKKRAVRFADEAASTVDKEPSAAPTASSAGSKSGLEKTIREMLTHYKPSSAERRPFWCRICRVQNEDLPAFEQHRDSFEHKLAADIEKKMSFCKECRKQFTSIDQLREHCAGKAHAETEARRAAGRVGGKLSFS